MALLRVGSYRSIGPLSFLVSFSVLILVLATGITPGGGGQRSSPFSNTSDAL